MYQPPELPVIFEEHPVNAHLSDQASYIRLWTPPLPLRVRHTGLRNLGVLAPPPPGFVAKTRLFTVPVHGTSHLLSYPSDKHWLVLALTLPGGVPPTDPFANESPHSRVDGAPCKGTMTCSHLGVGQMIYTDLSRTTLAGLTASVLESEPDSRILVRLLPRRARAVVRFFRSSGHLQFWTAI